MSSVRWLVLGDLSALAIYVFRWWWDTRPAPVVTPSASGDES